MIRFHTEPDVFASELDAIAGSGARIVLFDDQRALAGAIARVDTEAAVGEVARATVASRAGADLRSATAAACRDLADALLLEGPFVAAFPRAVTYAQSQLALELGQRDIDVIVGEDRALFEQIIDERRAVRRSSAVVRQTNWKA
jgi:hypothetical protein